jgi:hypothetical protein
MQSEKCLQTEIEEHNKKLAALVSEGKLTWAEVNRINCIGGSVAHLYRPRFDFDSGKRLKDS